MNNTTSRLGGRPIVPVMNGARCCGYAFNRGPQGCRAIDPDDTNVGIFKTFDEVAQAQLEREAAA